MSATTKHEKEDQKRGKIKCIGICCFGIASVTIASVFLSILLIVFILFCFDVVVFFLADAVCLQKLSAYLCVWCVCL